MNRRIVFVESRNVLNVKYIIINKKKNVHDKHVACIFLMSYGAVLYIPTCLLRRKVVNVYTVGGNKNVLFEAKKRSNEHKS